MGSQFITLRRRSRQMLTTIHQTPVSAWRRVELKNVTRAYRRPRVLDHRVYLRDDQGPIRQLIVADLGHEEPTVLLTNQRRRAAPPLIERYAPRMLSENGMADGIDFFHRDALSSAVARQVTCDLQLTLMASSLSRLLGAQIGKGYADAKARHIVRDFIDAVGHLTLAEDEIIVRYQKRAHNPLLIAAGFARMNVAVPWLAGKRLRLVFG